MLAMFGMVMAYGIKMLSSVDFGRQENLLIVACSVGWAWRNSRSYIIFTTSRKHSYFNR